MNGKVGAREERSFVGRLSTVFVTDIIIFAIVKVVFGIVVVLFVFVVAEIFGFGGCIADVVFGLRAW